MKIVLSNYLLLGRIPAFSASIEVKCIECNEDLIFLDSEIFQEKVASMRRRMYWGSRIIIKERKITQ